jgi:hypothetical protein
MYHHRDDDGNCDDDDDNDDDNEVRCFVKARGYGRDKLTGNSSSGASSSDEDLFFRSKQKHRHKKSIVHKDVVMRPQHQQHNGDTEDIAVDHASRRRAIITGDDHSDDGDGYGGGDGEKDDDDDDEEGANKYEDKKDKDKRFKHSRALGFDLMQSLAAIDDWVDRGDGGEEDDDVYDKEELQRNMTMGHTPSKTTTNFKDQGSDHQGEPPQPLVRANGVVYKAAVDADDSDLVRMLQSGGKNPMLRSKSGFRDFFKAVPIDRVQSILERAYEHMPEPQRIDKINKRLAILQIQ